MPKPKTDAVHRHFNYDEVANYSRCTICNGKIKGRHATNLKHHMAVKHHNEFQDIVTVNNTTQRQHGSSQKRNNVIAEIKINCLKLVTVHGRPLELLEDAAFQEIINTIIPKNNCINIQSIKSFIAEKSYDIKLKISTELSQKLLCLKLDLTTYQTRSFLGISVQYIQNGTLNMHTLAVQEVFNGQIAKVLKNALLKALSDYQIDATQIYSITTDTGNFSKKMANLLDDSHQQLDFDEETVRHNVDSETDEKDDDRPNEWGQEIPMDVLLTALNEVENYSLSFLPRTMICAAHTLQLAVKDFIESCPEVEDVIFRVRQVVRLLKRPTVRNILKRANLKKPIIDCPTRWTSTFDMLVRLQSLKTICLSDPNIMSRLDAARWQTITVIISCLEPCHIATLKLQREQLTLGDFFIEWLACKGNLEKRGSLISQSLLRCMKEQENNLLKTDVMLEALYLDTRVNGILSNIQAVKARELLKETLNKINKLDLNGIDLKSDDLSDHSNDEPMAGSSDAQNLNSTDKKDPISFAEEILIRTEEQRAIVQTRESSTLDVLLRELRNLPRLAIKENIFEYWGGNLSIPELRELAFCVLATPASQVSFKSVFSSVNYILSPVRSSLDHDTLADIIVIRNNEDLLM